MNKEKPQTIKQRENSKHKLVKKLVVNSQNIISNEVGLSVGVQKMSRYITWLEQIGVSINLPVFEEYNKAVIAIPSGKERLNCSREALHRYDKCLYPINMEFHDRILDACFEIIKTFANVNDVQDPNE